MPEPLVRKDGFLNLSCSYCHQLFHKDDTVIYRGQKPYHKHHAKHHRPERPLPVTASEDGHFRIIPRGVRLKDVI